MHVLRHDNAVGCLTTGQCARRQLEVSLYMPLHRPAQQLSKQIAADMADYKIYRIQLSRQIAAEMIK